MSKLPELPEELRGPIDYQLYQLYKILDKPAIRVPETSQEMVTVHKEGDSFEVPVSLFDSFIFPQPVDGALRQLWQSLDKCNIDNAFEGYITVVHEMWKMETELDNKIKESPSEKFLIGKRLINNLELEMSRNLIWSLEKCSCSCKVKE